MRTSLKPGPLVIAALVLAGCGGGGGGGSGGGGGGSPPPPPPPPASETYTVTLTEIRVERTADQQPLVVDGVPADGATLTVR